MNKRYVIYTALIGGYDNIQQPLITDNRFDYVLFADDVTTSPIGVWQVRKVDYFSSNPIRIARYVKTHPMELLPGYDFSVWMDANLQINSMYVYEKSLELFSSNALIASVQHPERDCVYDEVHQMVGQSFESDEMGLKWANYLWRHHYPFHNGLHETNIVWRRHNEETAMFNKCWWNYIEHYSHRDQFSFNYTLRQLGIACSLFLPEGVHSANTEHINFIQHPDISKQRKKVPCSPKQWRRLKYFYFDGEEKRISRKKKLKNLIRFRPAKCILELMYWYIRLHDDLTYLQNKLRRKYI